MMFKFKKDKLTGYESVYAGKIKKRKTLKNGWHYLLLKDDSIVLFYDNLREVIVKNVKKVFEANDGKFMLTLKTGEKAVYDKSGKMLTLFDKQNELFFNGWYRVAEGNGLLLLYDASNEVVGKHLRKAEVFKDGRYYMSVEPKGESKNGGLFTPNKTNVFSCNDSDFKLLKNGWFISDGSLYDDTGTFFIGKEDGIELPLVYLIFIGFLMPKIRL